MQNEQVIIQEVNDANWYECCKLQISEAQQLFLEPNAISILQAKFEPTLKAYAINLDEKIVGFLMFNTVLEELDGYWIYRIMVDQQYQGKGIGKRAMQLMITEIKKLPNAKKIVVGYHTENKNAHYLYESLGFIDYGDRFGKEMAVVKMIES